MSRWRSTTDDGRAPGIVFPRERIRSMWNIGALVGAALVGFCAGLWSFRVKSRWCPECGRTTYPLADRRGG